MPDPHILLIAATFLLAGIVKGVIGLGLPTVSLALLAVTIDLPTAMVLLLVPSLVTNLWQAAVGGHGRDILARCWPFLLLAGASVWIGAAALDRIDLRWLSALLGLLLACYAGISLGGIRLDIDPLRERWSGPLFGAINGVLTGMTGSFVVPGVIYLQAIGLGRDALVQAMGMLFTLSTLALGLALLDHGRLSPQLGIDSAIGLPPAILGMLLGRRLRRSLSEALFRRVFFIALLALGGYIVLRAIPGSG